MVCSVHPVEQIAIQAEKARQATLDMCVNAAKQAPRRLLLGGSNDVGITATIKRFSTLVDQPATILTNRARGRIALWEHLKYHIVQSQNKAVSLHLMVPWNLRQYQVFFLRISVMKEAGN